MKELWTPPPSGGLWPGRHGRVGEWQDVKAADPLCVGQVGAGPHGFLFLVTSLPGRLRDPQPVLDSQRAPDPGANLSGCWEPSLQGVEKLTPQPQLPGVLQENENPGVDPTGASGEQFRVSRCYLCVRGQGAVHRAPLSLTSLPGWIPPPEDTCICICSSHTHGGGGRPLPASRRLLVPPGLCAVWCATAQPGREASASRPQWELSQCPMLALGRQAIIGDPSLLSFNVLNSCV